MHAFSYHSPKTVRQAASLLGKSDDAKLLAGGQTLLPTMKQRLASPTHLVDLGKVEGLASIEQKGRNIVIGAMTLHADVATSAVVLQAIPALAALAGGIGDAQVRNRGTIGGSLANNDPAADYPAAVLALDAVVTTSAGSHGADDYFQGMFTTALADGEIVTGVAFKVPQASAYAKFRHPASRYAVVGIFVARFAAGVRVAVTGAGPGVFRWAEAEAALGVDFSAGAVAGLTLDPADLNTDIHASAEYRGHLAGVMLGRAVTAAR